jgi:putative transposase
MPRANRYWVKGAAYHLTHRCHDRQFLFRVAADRDAYRQLLRQHLKKSPVSMLTYTITSNHVHLLVTAESAEAIADLMRRVQGEFAAGYNQRNGRSGAFWSDRYHATMIDDGEHLLSCLRYIDLNMIRAGAALHPREWSWTGWHELVGLKRRNRLLDVDALLRRIPGQTRESFSGFYQRFIDEALATENRSKRDPCWTSALAVGALPFLQRIESSLSTENKRKEMHRDRQSDGPWVLREKRLDEFMVTKNEQSSGAIRGDM